MSSTNCGGLRGPALCREQTCMVKRQAVLCRLNRLVGDWPHPNRHRYRPRDQQGPRRRARPSRRCLDFIQCFASDQGIPDRRTCPFLVFQVPLLPDPDPDSDVNRDVNSDVPTRPRFSNPLPIAMRSRRSIDHTLGNTENKLALPADIFTGKRQLKIVL